MAQVTFDPAVGGDGSVVSDDSSPTTGLLNYGWVSRFVPALAQIVAIAQNALSNAAAAAASAASAVLAPGTSATSTTSMSIVGVGSTPTFTLAQTGKAFAIGQTVVISRTSTSTNQMIAIITAFNSGTGVMTVYVLSSNGSGSDTAWTIALSGPATGFMATSWMLTAAGLATGGGTGAANRTITVTKATGAEVLTATDDTHAVTPKAIADASLIGTETDGATVTPAFGGNTFSRKVTLAGNRTIAAPTGCKEGQTYVLNVIQDATGSRTATWNAAYDWGSSGTPTLSTGANKRDIVFLYCYDAATPKFAASFWKAA